MRQSVRQYVEEIAHERDQSSDNSSQISTDSLGEKELKNSNQEENAIQSKNALSNKLAQMKKAKSDMPQGVPALSSARNKSNNNSIVAPGAPSESSAAMLPLDGLRHTDNDSNSFATETELGSAPHKGAGTGKSKKEYNSVAVAEMIEEQDEHEHEGDETAEQLKKSGTNQFHVKLLDKKKKSAQLKKSLDAPDKASKKKVDGIKEDYNVYTYVSKTKV